MGYFLFSVSKSCTKASCQYYQKTEIEKCVGASIRQSVYRHCSVFVFTVIMQPLTMCDQTRREKQVACSNKEVMLNNK